MAVRAGKLQAKWIWDLPGSRGEMTGLFLVIRLWDRNQCLQGHLVLSPSCALLWVTDPNFNVLLHKSTYPLERCCKIEVDSSAGTNKQMFLLNMHRETNCTHNPTGPPREIEVFIPFAPEAASTAHHWLLQMGDQFTFYSARTCCLFHSIELMSYSKAHRKR